MQCYTVSNINSTSSVIWCETAPYLNVDLDGGTRIPIAPSTQLQSGGSRQQFARASVSFNGDRQPLIIGETETGNRRSDAILVLVKIENSPDTRYRPCYRGSSDKVIFVAQTAIDGAVNFQARPTRQALIALPKSERIVVSFENSEEERLEDADLIIWMHQGSLLCTRRNYFELVTSESNEVLD